VFAARAYALTRACRALLRELEAALDFLQVRYEEL